MDENINQTLISDRTGLEYDKPDDELLFAIDSAINESKELKSKMDKVADFNFDYWQKGTHEDLTKIHPTKSKVVVNRIFTDMETSIPIITSETPEPAILGAIDNNAKTKIIKALDNAYDVSSKMQQVLQVMVRSWYISRIGIIKYRFDGEKCITENVSPRNIGFDGRATGIYRDCEYVWEQLEDTQENLIAKFPKKKKEIEQIFGQDKTPKSKIRYIEFWGGGGEWVCWKLKNIILDKKKNPNFDYDNPDNNLFEKPRFPYIILNVFHTGKGNGLYDETSLIEECAPIQESVNKLEQIIFDLNEGRKRVWIASGEAISEEKAQKLINETGDLMVYLDRKGNKDAVGQVQAGNPDSGMYNNLTHLLGEIDNIMGMHSTTRGERAQQETATGRQLLVGSDYGRMDLIVRNLEQCAEDWFNAYLQMLKVYQYGEVFGEDGGQVELRADEIPTNISIMVTKGSTLPIDDKSKKDNAIALAQMGMIDPQSLLEEMGYPDTEERVQRLYQWLAATGRMNPQAVGAQQGGEQVQEQQLQRIQSLVNLPQFKQLPESEQREYLQQARQAVAKVAEQQQ